MRPLFSARRDAAVLLAIASFASTPSLPARAAIPLTACTYTLTLTTSNATPTFGQSITLTAALTFMSSCPAPLLGAFSIYDGSSALVSGALPNEPDEKFIYSISSLSVGKHTLVAKYASSISGVSATSNKVPVQVAAARAPAISSLIPSSASSGDSGFELTVKGSGFYSSSFVEWNGGAVTTSYVSAKELRAQISASDIATAGVASVMVVNPSAEGGASAASRFTITGTVPANDRFVATDGNDDNSGTISRPYRTIQKCASTVASGGTCQVRAGTYRETVMPSSGITITSYDGEQVTVDGSDPVTGWTLYKGSIYKAKVTLSSGDTNQVFVGDQMMTEARWPNGDDLFHVNWATAENGTDETMLVDSHLPNIDWKGAKIHLWSGTDPWDPQTGAVTASESKKLTFTVDGASYPPYIQPQPGGYYYLFGILAALDTENEWFYDASAGVLYFWAPGGVNPNRLNVRAKQRQFAFDLSGKANITIENIHLFASTINTDSSSEDNTLDSIEAQYVSHFTSLPDTPGYSSSYWYAHLADTGIVLNGSGNVLENSSIAWSAGNGVTMLGSHNTVKNTLIHDVDYMADYCAGISLQGVDQTVTNNTVYSTGRFALYPTFIQTGSGPDSADIGYNNFYNAMELSRDGGEIYAGYSTQVSGTRIHNNWFHDTQSLYPGPADTYPLAGVYLDDAHGFEVDQNVLWNNEYQTIFLHGAGFDIANDNYVHNNSIPDVNSTAYIWLFQIPDCGTTRVVNNRVLVPPQLDQVTGACGVADNSPTAPGADQMNSSVAVGCNFAGCSSEGPPEIRGDQVGASVAIQPLSLSIAEGEKATFTVTAAGSAPITYQWMWNAVAIPGANDASYTTSALDAADNGAVITVEVSNPIGSATSIPATLTVY